MTTSTNDAKAVPLIERLRSVPSNAVLRIDTPNALPGCFDTRSIPVGPWCHEAAEAISAAPSPEKEREALLTKDQIAQVMKLVEEVENGRFDMACGLCSPAFYTGKDRRDKGRDALRAYLESLRAAVSPAPETANEPVVAKLMQLADDYANLTAVSETEVIISGGDLTAEEREADDARSDLEDAIREAFPAVAEGKAASVLRDLDERLRLCFSEPITAEEAYDSFYQEMVADVLNPDAAASPAVPAPAPAPHIDPMQDPMRPTFAKLGPDNEHPAEQVLRKLACWLGVGGYNAPTVDAEELHRKIVWGVEWLLKGNAAMAAPAPAGWMPIETAPDEVWALGHGWQAHVKRAVNCWVLMNPDLAHRVLHPTHWMPLPASPRSAAAGDANPEFISEVTRLAAAIEASGYRRGLDRRAPSDYEPEISALVRYVAAAGSSNTNTETMGE